MLDAKIIQIWWKQWKNKEKNIIFLQFLFSNWRFDFAEGTILEFDET